MTQSAQVEKLFHLFIGVISLGLLCLLTTHITAHVSGDGTFPWWVYPAYGAYTLAILMLDHILFRRDADE